MASFHESTARPDRKTIEKNRRNHMKFLISKLISLLPPANSKEGAVVPLPERLDEAINYIKDMQAKAERMTKRKRQLMASAGMSAEAGTSAAAGSSSSESLLPEIEVQELSSGLRVVILSRPSEHLLPLSEVVRVLGVEGFEVVTASYAVSGDRAFHTVQSLSSTGLSTGAGGEGAGKVLERLKKAVHANF